MEQSEIIAMCQPYWHTETSCDTGVKALNKVKNKQLCDRENFNTNPFFLLGIKEIYMEMGLYD